MSVVSEHDAERLAEEAAADRRFETMLLVRGIVIVAIVAALVVARVLLDAT